MARWDNKGNGPWAPTRTDWARPFTLIPRGRYRPPIHFPSPSLPWSCISIFVSGMRSYLRRPFPTASRSSSFVCQTPARPGLCLFRMASTVATPARTLPRLPVFEAIARHDPESTVVVHSLSGRRFKYGELLGDVCNTRDRLYEASGKDDIEGERIAFLVENSYDYVGKRALNCLHG